MGSSFADIVRKGEDQGCSEIMSRVLDYTVVGPDSLLARPGRAQAVALKSTILDDLQDLDDGGTLILCFDLHASTTIAVVITCSFRKPFRFETHVKMQ